MLNKEKEDQLFIIKEKIDELSYHILSKILTKQVCNQDIVEELYATLDRLKDLMHNEKYIPRYLAGKLFSIYMTIEGEAGYSRNSNNPLYMMTAYLQSYLADIFGGHEKY